MMKMLRALAALVLIGTVAVAQPVGQLPSATVWGNPGASRAIASAATMTAMLDRAFCTTQNAALFRNATTWICLASANNGVWITSGTGVPSISSTLPNAVQDNIVRLGTIGFGVWNGTVIGVQFGGTGLASGTSGGIPYFSGGTTMASSGVLGAGQIVLGGGAGAAPTVLSCATSTTVLHGGTPPTCAQVNLGTDVTGDLPLGNIADIASLTVLSNVTGGLAAPAANSPSAILDAAFSSTQGAVLYRGASAWLALGPGTSGQFLKTQGAGANPIWDAPPGSGTVTSVVCGNQTITTSGTCFTDTGLYLQNCSLAASVAANALTIAIKNAAGSDPSATSPCTVFFRGANDNDGTITAVYVTAATSLTISSGSTLGATNNVPFRVWVTAFNDSGTFRLAASNRSTVSLGSSGIIYPLNEETAQSSTAEGGAGGADSLGTFYTGTAVTTKAMRVIGYLDWASGLATAGTWASAPTKIQLFGPGVRLPGAVIQSSSIFTGTPTTTTTTATPGAVTNLTTNIQLTSPVNLIKVHGVGGLESDNASSSANAKIYRNASQAVGNALQLYPQVFYGSGLTFLGWDKPATTSVVTYAAYLRASGGTTVHFLPNGVGGQEGYLIVEEIQG